MINTHTGIVLEDEDDGEEDTTADDIADTFDRPRPAPDIPFN